MNRKGELFINDMDAFGMWGVCLSDSSLCSLIEPEPLKDAVSNKSSTEDGKQIMTADTYAGCERYWNRCGGIYEDENGEHYIYIEEVK